MITRSLPAAEAKTTEVGAVIVTYYPDEPKLKALLAALSPQVGAVMIVDNSGKDNQNHFLLDLANDYSCELICLQENLGIGAAQNRGVLALRQLPFIQYLLFLDQDSLPSSQMASSLLTAFIKLDNLGYRVGAVGPSSFVAKLGAPISFINYGFLNTQKMICSSSDQLIVTEHLISSGTFTSMAIFNEVGGFREDLFVDYVDVEWCLRLAKKGYRLWGICAAMMEHDLGEDPIALFGRLFFTHSPLRHYYLIRNGITLYKASDISFRWKCSDMPRLLVKSIFYLMLSKPQLTHMRMMGRGFCDGLRGRLGKFR